MGLMRDIQFLNGSGWYFQYRVMVVVRSFLPLVCIVALLHRFVVASLCRSLVLSLRRCVVATFVAVVVDVVVVVVGLLFFV